MFTSVKFSFKTIFYILYPQYCVETGKTAEKRFVGHRNTIVQGCLEHTNLSVGQNFREPGHSVADLFFTPIERIYSRNVFVGKLERDI